MKTVGIACRPIGEALEEFSINLKEHAEVITLLGWGDQARTLQEFATTIEKIARQVRSGRMDADLQPAYLSRNV